VEEATEDDDVISTAAAATVEHPGVFLVRTDKTSAKGVLFKEPDPLVLEPDSNHETEDGLWFGERG